MKIVFVAMLAALSAGVAPVLAQTQQVTPGYKVVGRGQTIKLGAYGSFDPDCRSLGRPSVNLLSAPQGGRAEIEDGYDYPAFAANNVRFRCDRVRGPEAVLYYHASRDFVGQDSFMIEVVFATGEARQYRWTVYVR